MMDNKKYLNKYDNVEDLENGYKALQTRHDELAQQKNKYSVPEQYELNGNAKLAESNLIESATEFAKDLNYTQAQFDKYLENKINKNKSNLDRLEEIKQIEQLEDIKTFATSELGLSEKSFNKLSKDEIVKLNERREKLSMPASTTISSAYVAPRNNALDRQTAFKQLKDAERYGSSQDVADALKHYSQVSKSC